MNTPFKTLPKEEQQEWREAYDEYKKRMGVLYPRPFSEWLTDFGFTHKEE